MPQSSSTSSDHHKHLKQRLYHAARHGLVDRLENALEPLSFEKAVKLLNAPHAHGVTLVTPLMVASIYGHLSIVELLIKKYKVDVETEGVVEFENYPIQGTTALWCACSHGHLPIVVCLYQSGHADLNHATRSLSTPLRAACFNGRLPIVEFLVRNGADYNLANKFDSTCLMIAAYNGHLPVVEYLMKLPLDPDRQAKCGSTALHFAAENGHLEVAKCLLSHNAKMLRNSSGLTPLTTAAESTKANIVEYFISNEQTNRESKVEALELLGASFANDKENYSLDRCYYYLKQAMLERFRPNTKPLIKESLDSSGLRAFGYEVEVRTMEELEELKFQAHRLHMQGLIIRQRILGCKSETVHPIVYRGAVYADHEQFDTCLELWMHALNINASIDHSCISNDLLRFAQIFCQMLNLGVSFDSDYIEQVLETAFTDMRTSARLLYEYRTNKSSNDSECQSLADRLQDELDENLLYTLYLLVLIAKILPNLPTNRQRSLCSLVYRINQLRLCTRPGATLLHLCVDSRTPVGDAYTKSVCKFPCSATAGLLIRCGADVNQTDKAGNTPLHVISSYERVISNFLTVHSIISQLLAAGAHHDYTNQALQTPLDRVVVSVAELILKSQVHIRLSCLAARAVNKHRISYNGLVPNHLHEFILKHQIKS